MVKLTASPLEKLHKATSTAGIKLHLKGTFGTWDQQVILLSDQATKKIPLEKFTMKLFITN